MSHGQVDDKHKAHKSYFRQDDGTLDSNGLRQHCVLDAGRHALHPIFNLGELDILPPELLTNVLAQLDVQSLTDFRRVNQQAMRITDSVPQYQAVVEHASDALRGMLSIGSASFSTIDDLYDKLCTVTCDTCYRDGNYLYLITCKRVCFWCLGRKESFLPLSRADIVRKYGLQPSQTARIARMGSRPGRYSERRLICRKSLTLFDHDSARSMGISVHGTVEMMEEYVEKAAMRRWSNFKDRQSQHLSRGNTGKKPRPPRVGDAWDALFGNAHRYMAIVSIPYFNAQTRSAQRGFYCKGCRHAGVVEDEDAGPDMDRRRQYYSETFDDHMKKWGKIKKGFHLKDPYKYILPYSVQESDEASSAS